jgi:HK97 gp10 family phage protein
MNNAISVDTAALVKSLDKFSNNVRIGITKVASRRSAAIVKKEMVNLAPYKTGSTRKSILARTKTDKAGGRAFSVIGPFGKQPNKEGKKVSQAYKANFLEHGTVNMRAQPFIAKSLENTKDRVEKEYEAQVNKQLAKL